MSALCLPCCTVPVPCLCFYPTGTSDGGVLGGIILDTSTDARAFALAYIAECVAVDASHFFFPSFSPASFSADNSVANQLTMTQVTDTASAANQGSVFRTKVIVDDGTLTMAWNISGNPPGGVGGEIFLVIVDCTGETIISIGGSVLSGTPPWTGTLTKSGLPAGQYLVEVFISWGGDIMGPSAPVTSVITIGNDSTLFPLHAYAEWFDEAILDAVLAELGITFDEFVALIASLGLTLQQGYVLVGAAGYFPACPDLELPMDRYFGTDPNAEFIDLAAAEAALASTDPFGSNWIPIDCLAVFNRSSGTGGWTGSASGSTFDFTADELAIDTISASMRITMSLDTGSVLNFSGTLAGINLGYEHVWEISITDRNAYTQFAGDVYDPSITTTFSGSFTVPAAGQYYIEILRRVGTSGDTPGDLTLGMDTVFSCADMVIGSVVAYYDDGLSCPKPLDCS